MLFISYSINRLTGTDGFRVLCHQFHTSSLPLWAHCIKRCSTCLLRKKQLREAPSCCDEAAASRAKAVGRRSSRFSVADGAASWGGAEGTAPDSCIRVWCLA